MEKIKIFIVDDHKMIRDSIKGYLVKEAKYQIVGEAANGKEALKALEYNQADVILTDISMPEMDGVSLTKEINTIYDSQNVIALTMMNESQHIKQMVSNGAKGYLLKDCDEVEIKRAIDTVVRGESYYAQEVTKVIMENMRNSKKSKSRVAVEMPLTRREMDVLKLIVQENTNQEIADKLCISIRTVDAHKHNLIEKTGSKNVVGLVVYAMDRGII